MLDISWWIGMEDALVGLAFCPMLRCLSTRKCSRPLHAAAHHYLVWVCGFRYHDISEWDESESSEDCGRGILRMGENNKGVAMRGSKACTHNITQRDIVEYREKHHKAAGIPPGMTTHSDKNLLRCSENQGCSRDKADDYELQRYITQLLL